MKPFSPLYFIKENKSRCILLMFMIFLGWGVYLGGLYASNPYDNWKLPIAMYDEMALISPSDTEEENDLEPLWDLKVAIFPLPFLMWRILKSSAII